MRPNTIRKEWSQPTGEGETVVQKEAAFPRLTLPLVERRTLDPKSIDGPGISPNAFAHPMNLASIPSFFIVSSY
jgi:hypothetical protein